MNVGRVLSEPPAWLWWLLLPLGALLFFHGIALSDEYLYAFNAREWLHGHWPQTPSPFAHRLGFVWPLAAFMYLLGGAPYVLILPSLLAFWGLVWMVHSFEKSALYPSFAPAALLLALNPVLLYHAADVSHDMLMVSLATVAVLLLWRYRGPRSGVLFSLLLFWAFLCKESVVYLLPFVFWIFVKDIWGMRGGEPVPSERYRRTLLRSFWPWAIGTALFLGIAYLGIYAWWKGDPWYRFAGMANHNLGPYSYHGKSLGEKLLRLTVYPFVFLLRSPGFGVLWVPVVGVLSVPSLRRELWHKAGFPLVWLFSLLFMHWLGSSSLSEWNPLTLDDRMWMLLLPPLAIVAIRADVVLRRAFRLRFNKVNALREDLVFQKNVLAEIRRAQAGLRPGFRELSGRGKGFADFTWKALALGAAFGLLFFPHQLAGLWAVLITALWYWFLSGRIAALMEMYRQHFLLRRHFSLIVPILLAAVVSLFALPRRDGFSRERAFLQQLAKRAGEEKILLLTDSLLVDKPLAHFDFKPDKMQQLELMDWWDFPEGNLPEKRKIYLLYNPRRVELMCNFFHRAPPAWVQQKVRGEKGGLRQVFLLDLD